MNDNSVGGIYLGPSNNSHNFRSASGTVLLSVDTSQVLVNNATDYDVPSGNSSFRVEGGAGIGKSLYVGGWLALRNGTNAVGFKAGTLSTTTIWTLPTADGTSNQVLTTNGSGVLV